MITYFSNYKPIGPGRKNGMVDVGNLDRMLQDSAFHVKTAPGYLHPLRAGNRIRGGEEVSKAKGLTVDGAVKNKDSETGRA